MESPVIWIVGIVVGLPVVLGIGYAMFEHFMNVRVRLRELKVKELQAKAELQLRNDELNARILRMDDMGISPTDLLALRDEVRQLREEMSRIRQDVNSRTG